MAHDPDKRTALRDGYIRGLSLADAAIAAGVPYATARNWKRQSAASGDDWDIARNARRMSGSGIEAMANEVLGSLAEQYLITINMLKAAPPKEVNAQQRAEILVRLMDGYNKAISASASACARAMPNANRLAAAMDVVRFLTALVAERAPKLREPFIALIEASGDDLVREFGSKQ